jgi:hypothetical protein
VALASKRDKGQLLLKFNAGHLCRHGVLACIDLQSKGLIKFEEFFIALKNSPYQKQDSIIL